MPPGDAPGDGGAVNASGELLDASEQCIAVHYEGQRLYQAYMWVSLHCVGQPNDCVAHHQAVRVEDDHVLVATAKALHPLGDVARLPADILLAMTIKNSHQAGPVDKL